MSKQLGSLPVLSVILVYKVEWHPEVGIITGCGDVSSARGGRCLPYSLVGRVDTVPVITKYIL